MIFNAIQIAFSSEEKLQITEEFVAKFGDLTGDKNPIHFDKNFKKKTFFKGKIVHGMISANLIATLLSKNFPGAIYVSQSLNFLKPVKINDVITAKFKILKKDEKSKKVILWTACFNQKNEKVLEGEAIIKILDF